MTQTNLHMTIFDIYKLKNIVGLGSASPFQITTYPGKMVGMVGTITDPAKIIASNDHNSDSETATSTSWIQRALSASGLQRG